MAAALKKDYSLDEMEVKYNTICDLYDLADELLATVDSPFVKDKEAQINLIEPLVAELSEVADILGEEFINVAQARGDSTKAINKTRIENAFRKAFAAIDEYKEKAKASSKKMGGLIRNIADPIVKKIKRHLEEVVVIFLEFVHLSLASMMHHQQLEALRVRDQRIALMMHQHTLSQQ